MALTAYQTQTQALLHDPNAQAYSLTDITRYINLARNWVAAQGECVRVPLSGGTITALSITNGGTGYSSPVTVSITGNGSQAFATATQAGGVINSVTLTSGGWGFITGTTVTVTVTNGGGTGAIITPTIDNSATTSTGQEVVMFSQLNTLLATWQSNGITGTRGPTPFPGLSQVYKVFTVAISQSGTFKPMMEPKSWGEFQAYLRIYQNTQQNYPVYWSQYQYGVNGCFYLFPYPAQPLQMDVDCCCLPIALVNDSTIEAIPYPWTDAIPYYAAYLAFQNSSRNEDSDRMLAMYKTFMERGRLTAEAPVFTNIYGYE